MDHFELFQRLAFAMLTALAGGLAGFLLGLTLDPLAGVLGPRA